MSKVARRNPQTSELLFTETTTDVATALEDVGGEIVLGGHYPIVCFEVANTGQALADFAVFIQMYDGGTWISYIDGDAFAVVHGAVTATGVMLWATSGLKTLASGSVGAAHIDVGAAFAIKFQADSSSSTTSVTVKGFASARS